MSRSKAARNAKPGRRQWCWLPSWFFEAGACTSREMFQGGVIMADRLVGKVALVTGAGSGIGRATAQRFTEEGAKVIVDDIDEQDGNETVRLIREAGGEATFIKADVSQASEVEALIQAAVDTYGRLDYAHNNAGIG